MKIHFDKNLRLLRNKRGLSQAGLVMALKYKATIRVINAYEDGSIDPDLEMLILFSNFFKVTIDELIKIDLSKKIIEQDEIEGINPHFVTDTDGSYDLLIKNLRESQKKTYEFGK